MKINCPQCNKKISVSLIERVYSRLLDKKIVCWIEKRCDKCRYLVSDWEAPEGYQPEISKTHSIKLENHSIYHEKIIYSDEDKAGFTTKEEFFRDSKLIKEIFNANKEWEKLSVEERKELEEKIRGSYKKAREYRKHGEINS